VNPSDTLIGRHGPTTRLAAAAASLVVLGALAVVGTGPALAVNGGACKAPYDLTVNPADYTDGSGHPNAIDNPYFPLLPGTTWTYDGSKEGKALHDVMTVTSDTKTIMGVTIRVVRDTAWEDGVLNENTFDYYAQDDAGNVWYFGEDTTEFDENGNPETTEGSWQAGDGPNLPGILMLAQPRAGQTYRQEYGPGVAVDMGTVINLHRHVTEPAGSYRNVVETKEYSCIEKGIDHKMYAPGVGLISELALANGQEWINLVSVTH
jgi:hypothetical protein